MNNHYELRKTAYHEAGHAYVIGLKHFYNETQTKIEEASIVPTDDYLGYVQCDGNLSRVCDRLVFFMAGRASEYVFGLDNWVDWRAVDPYGHGFDLFRAYSEMILANATRLQALRAIQEAYETAVAVIKNNQSVVTAIAEELLYKNKLSGRRVDAIINRSETRRFASGTGFSWLLVGMMKALGMNNELYGYAGYQDYLASELRRVWTNK